MAACQQAQPEQAAQQCPALSAMVARARQAGSAVSVTHGEVVTIRLPTVTVTQA
jgi:hypothetical protein